MALVNISSVLIVILSIACFSHARIILDDPEEFKCPPNTSGAFAHETACEKYYLCNNGTAALLTCPEGLLFDIELLTCNFADLVDCADRTKPTVPPPTTAAPTEAPVTGEYECEQPGGAFAHPIYCEKYYICVDNEATEFTCPEDQLFDEKYDGCNWAELVYCGDRIRPNGTATMIPTIVPSVTPDPEFECPEPGGAFEHPVYCELYYLCVEDVPTLEICPPDQLFDTIYHGCNWDYLVDCGDRIPPGSTGSPGTRPTTTKKPTTPPGTGPTKPPPEEFECPEPTGIFADPADCSAFYMCDNGVGNHNVCPAPLLFNDVVQACDFEINVDCGSRPIP